IALLGLAARAGLIPGTLAAETADAYRVFRRRQHTLRLQGADKARVPPAEFAREREAVRQLWAHVLENKGRGGGAGCGVGRIRPPPPGTLRPAWARNGRR